jgi:predicted small lipoprotein YifL
MKTLRLWLLLAVIVTEAACGQKGPLVLPDAQHPRKKVKLPSIPSKPSSPAAEKPAEPVPNPAPSDAPPETDTTPTPPQG